MKTLVEIELTRHNVTPAQFLAYVRSTLKKKNFRDYASDLDLDYFRRGNDINFYYHDEPEKPCKAEKSVSHPYEMQTYILNWDGSCYNEICEFEFDDIHTGHGYYYLLNTESENQEKTEEPEQKEEEKSMKQTVKTIYVNLSTIRTKTTESATEAMQWHRAGDKVRVDRGYKYTDIPGAAQQKQPDENWEHCKRIAEDLEAYANGEMYRCPECGEIHRVPEHIGDKYKCPSCGAVVDIDDMEQLGIYDFLEDVYDIEYRCGSDKEYRSVRIMVACGGPNIYIDTARKAVLLYWWTDSACYYLSDSAVNAVDEWAEEYWGCM